MSEHTPGPWSYEAMGDSDGEHGGIDHYVNIGGFLYFAPNEANGRLMAAAPDLLAACEAATEWFQRNGEEYAGDIEVYNQLRAALLKAKGGAS